MLLRVSLLEVESGLQHSVIIKQYLAEKTPRGDQEVIRRFARD